MRTRSWWEWSPIPLDIPPWYGSSCPCSNSTLSSNSNKFSLDKVLVKFWNILLLIRRGGWLEQFEEDGEHVIARRRNDDDWFRADLSTMGDANAGMGSIMSLERHRIIGRLIGEMPFQKAYISSPTAKLFSGVPVGVIESDIFSFSK